MTRKHFDELALQLGLRLAEAVYESEGLRPGFAEKARIAGFWTAVAGVRAAGRHFNAGFDSTRFDNKVIEVALHQLNIEHRFAPNAYEWTREDLIERPV